ncbi:hypothetical protein DFP72DRAFT_883734 [Ephemerocybe angulata]|uniref:Uncharacterized protein n=1 Tax=Ephemerocybe angulata TaxID=980116 RepID=A0A8H6I7D9_9AGAR|nr:hypothetical protein DFP72DRAFT_883734 [Tulosesus angulatus]
MHHPPSLRLSSFAIAGRNDKKQRFHNEWLVQSFRIGHLVAGIWKDSWAGVGCLNGIVEPPGRLTCRFVDRMAIKARPCLLANVVSLGPCNYSYLAGIHRVGAVRPVCGALLKSCGFALGNAWSCVPTLAPFVQEISRRSSFGSGPVLYGSASRSNACPTPTLLRVIEPRTVISAADIDDSSYSIKILPVVRLLTMARTFSIGLFLP